MAVHGSGKVVVGMSGGVDSSVAAALLCKEGCEVAGLSINLLTCSDPKDRSCCSARDRQDARDVCSQLGITHRVVDCRSEFKLKVIDPFVDEYINGRTPSPCILCNELIKFPALLSAALEMGYDFIATGHYARVKQDGDIYRLLKATDSAKDQSYFLFSLTQQILSRLILPLGEMTKPDVRRYAAACGLATREKSESQEVCFVADDDCARFVEERAGGRISGPGEFMDVRGNILGRHSGTHAYTIGQRRGLNIACGRRMYVLNIDREANRIVLGDDADLMRDELIARDVSWTHPSNATECRATVKIRSTDNGTPATLEIISDNRVRVKFHSPVRAVAPGQAAVFYRGDEVFGGGWIESGTLVR